MNRRQRRKSGRIPWSCGVFGEGMSAVAVLRSPATERDPANLMVSMLLAIAVDGHRRGFVGGDPPPTNFPPPDPAWVDWQLDDRGVAVELAGIGFVLLRADRRDWRPLIGSLVALLMERGLKCWEPTEGTVLEELVPVGVGGDA